MNFKENMVSLLKQISYVGFGLLMVLLFTKGNLSPLILGGTVVTGVLYVACTEEKRLTKLYEKFK